MNVFGSWPQARATDPSYERPKPHFEIELGEPVSKIKRYVIDFPRNESAFVLAAKVETSLTGTTKCVLFFDENNEVVAQYSFEHIAGYRLALENK